MARKKNQESDDFDPSQHFVLNDITLWTTSLKRQSDYETAKHDGKCIAQAFQAVKPELFKVEIAGSQDESILLRVLVELGVRSVFKEGDAEEVVFSLEATFAAEYFVIKPPPSPGKLKDFCDFNCVHNVWPFWRQHVFDTLRRASLPVPMVPLFAGRSGKRPKRFASLKRMPASGSKAE